MGTGSSADPCADVLSHPSGELSSPDIRVDQYSSEVIIRPLDGDPLELRLMDRELLRKQVTSFAYAVEDERPLGLPVEPATAQRFLSFAKEKAYHCFVDCTSNNIKMLQAARDIFTEVINTALLRERPPQIEIVDHGAQYLPWEWLGSPDCRTDLEAEAATLLGFAAVVYRRDVYRENQTGRSEFLTAQPMQVRFFRHPDLASTELEYRFFKFFSYAGAASMPVFRLLGPLPEPGRPLALVEQLADPLYSAPDGPDQVVHLSCHHKTKKDPRKLSGYELAFLESTLSFGNEELLEINVTDLENGLADIKGASEAVERPLVFFNRCRGDFHPGAAESVAGVLLRNSNRAVVSTSIKVPDDVAAEFGRFFYQRLLGGQRSAEALQCAKWDLLHRRGSPLGLLYTYYGQPALHVAPTVDIPPSGLSPAPIGG